MRNISNAYQKNVNDVLKYYQSSVSGLNQELVSKNKNKYGSNKIQDTKRKSIIMVFLEQFCNLLVIVLIIASILSLFTGGIENTIVILVVITLNAILGTFEYFKAEKSIESLKELSSLEAHVLRNNKKIVIDSNDVVCGDYVFLKSGDIVPSDIRIISASSLECDESMLTGESALCEKNSEVIDKDLPIGERKNILYRGTKIITGKAEGVVFSVGTDTEIGKISLMMQKIKKKKSPLEKDIDKFSKDLAIIILVICLIVFLMSVYRHISLLDSLMFAISLAVAAIPEALQTIVTIVLAISTEKIAKEKAIVKDIKALETLGNIDVICTDKTGTLTENKMIVEGFYYDNQELSSINNEVFKDALILCNDSNNDKNSKTVNTDDAIIRFFKEEEVLKIKDQYRRIYEIPFSSKRKMAVSVNLYKKDKMMFVKGASDLLLNACILSHNERKKIEKVIDEKSAKGYRVISVAYKKNPKEYTIDNLTFIGLVFIVDPIKEKAYETITELKKYHIRPIMITGDHVLTALNIARKTGINEGNDNYLTGEMLEKMSDDELKNKLDTVSVYARVSPSDKIRIVTLLQEKGYSVAFLGDGVNDAPAIKKADVGVSMGISGTEVSKEASDVILMDDNLATVMKAVKRGRKVYQNIQNAILFLIAGNIAGIFIVLYTSLLNLPIPFAPVHLLFINLINDSLPAIAIGIEEGSVDERELLYPRKKSSPLLSPKVVRRILIEGFLIAFFTNLSYLYGLKNDMYVSRTMVFVTITVARLFYSFNCRNRVSFILANNHKKKINKTLLFSIVVGLALVNSLLFVEGLHKMFAIASVELEEIAFAYIMGLLPYLSIQMIFIVRDLNYKRKNKEKKVISKIKCNA